MDMEIQQVPWWNRRSRLERRFFLAAVGLLMLSVGLAAGLVAVLYMGGESPGVGQTTTAAFTDSATSSSSHGTNGQWTGSRPPGAELGKDYCFTPGCVRTAAEILQNMDEVRHDSLAFSWPSFMCFL